MDIKPSSGKYTWSNRRTGPRHIAARLDRFLVQDSFLLLGLNLTSKILPFGGSDHKPIILEMEMNKNLGPIPFRFNPMWATQPDFQKLVADTWSPPVNGSSFYVWEEKLRRLKKKLRSWVKLLPSPNDNKIQAGLALEIHQAGMEENEVTSANIQAEIRLHSNLHDACRQEAEWWRTKARCK